MIAILLAAHLFFLAEGAPERFTYSESPVWSTKDGNILVYGKHIFNIRGVNWWGAQGGNNVPLGMKYHDIDWHLNILKEYGFNAIRYPVAIPTVMDASAKNKVSCKLEPELCTKGPMEFLETVIDKAGKLGIMIMLDLHTLGYYQGTPLWYNEDYSEADVLDTWDRMMELFKHKWNVFAIDLMNEPHGEVTWGSGDKRTDWRLAAIRFIEHISKNHPDYKGLFFVEGKCCGLGNWFRKGLDDFPVVTGNANLDNRVVYSGHHYRPGRKSGDHGKPLPPNATLLADLDEAFGKVVEQTGQPQVFGEFGDDLQNPLGMAWLELFTGWMVKNCMNNFFYWSLTGGVPGRGMVSIEDWTTVDVPKMKFLQTVQKKPTTIKKQGDKFLVVDRGQKCG